jgi:hypothetical protein
MENQITTLQILHNAHSKDQPEKLKVKPPKSDQVLGNLYLWIWSIANN